MAEGKAGTAWRRLLVPLVVTSGVTLVWVKARRRGSSGSLPRSWSELDASAPVSLRSPAVEPALEPAVEPVVEATAEPVVADPGPVPVAGAQATEEDLVSEQVAEALPDGPVPGPYPGSVLPLADGSAPSEEFVVKGNAGSMRSHSTSSPYFGRTRAEVWFRTQEDAAAAGFAPWAPKR